jgi:anaphase-promoting complex subunit 8
MKMSNSSNMMLIRDGLRSIITQAHARCLFQTSKWASENLIGMAEIADESSMISIPSIDGYSSNPKNSAMNATNKQSINYMISQSEYNLILHAQALIANSEYQRASHSLLNPRQASKRIESSLGLFLAYYSMYLSGERIKDQHLQEWIASDSPSLGNQATNSPAATGSESNMSEFKNPLLPELYHQLYELYSKSSEKMDSFLYYLFAVVSRDMQKQYGLRSTQQTLLGSITGKNHTATDSNPSTVDLFIISLRMNPMNWSAWLDLAAHYIGEHADIPSQAQLLSHPLPAHVEIPYQNSTLFHIMHLFFQAHISNEKQLGHEALEVLDPLHAIFPNSSYVSSAIALAQYTVRDYDQAQEIFEVVRAHDPYRLELIDTYSNILYVKEQRTELSHLAHILTKISKYSSETCCVIGNFYSLKGQHEKAIRYFTRALKLDANHVSAWTLMGHEYVELRNFACAVKCYQNACQFTSLDYRAWYGLGQCYEILHMFSYALYYYKKAASIRNHDSRMWCAVGSCYKHMNYTSFAIQAFECAVKYDDHEGIATKELAKLYRDQGKHDQAIRYYLNHWISLGYITSTDYHITNTMMHGLSSDQKLDENFVEGILYVGNYFFSKGYLSHAEEYCSLLLDYVGPEGEEARALLREIRSMMTSSAAGPRDHSMNMSMNMTSIHQDTEDFLLSTSDDDLALHANNTSQLRAFSMSTSSITSSTGNPNPRRLSNQISSPMNSSVAMSIDLEEDDEEC